MPTVADNCIKILTIDHHPLVQEGLAAVINHEPDMKVLAQALCGRDAIALFEEHRPDVVVLDLLLPDMAGEEVAKTLVEMYPGARVLALTSAQGDVRITRAMNAGVLGYLWKGMHNCELPKAIRQVNAGRRFIPREVASRLAEHLADERLTPREVQVLELVARGNRNKQVAARLTIADETVRMHMKHILGKLAAHDRTHAVTIALTRGVFQL